MKYTILLKYFQVGRD